MRPGDLRVWMQDVGPAAGTLFIYLRSIDDLFSEILIDGVIVRCTTEWIRLGSEEARNQ